MAHQLRKGARGRTPAGARDGSAGQGLREQRGVQPHGRHPLRHRLRLPHAARGGGGGAPRPSTSPTPSATPSPRSSRPSSAASWRTSPGADHVTLSVHCHNDLGLSTANSVAAIQAGARQVECTINGLGERAGNASLEEIVMAVQTRADFLDARTGINSEHLVSASRLVSDLSGMHVQHNKAIVGLNAFRHQSGHPPGRDRQAARDLRDHGPQGGRLDGRHHVRAQQAVRPRRFSRAPEGPRLRAGARGAEPRLPDLPGAGGQEDHRR